MERFIRTSHGLLHPRSALFALLATLLCGGCSQEDDLTVWVHDALEAKKIGAVSAGHGESFVVVDLEVANLTSESLPLLPPYFGLQTDQGLEYAGDPVTSLHADGCSENAAVIPGSNARCSIVFRVPSTSAGRTLVYRPVTTDTDKQNNKKYVATASLSVVPCSLCSGTECRYLDRDPRNCGVCGNDIGLGACVQARVVCDAKATWCGMRCVDLNSDASHCGACNKPVSAGWACSGGKPVCSAGLTLCSGTCVNTKTDPKHCGGCNRPVLNNGKCEGGKPGCGSLTACQNSCVDLDNDQNNCGACGKACKTGFDCEELSTGEHVCMKEFAPLVGGGEQTCFYVCYKQGNLSCYSGGHYENGQWWSVGCNKNFSQNSQDTFRCSCYYQP